MLYRLKLYPDSLTKEGTRILEIEADDAEVEEIGEGEFAVYHLFFKKYSDASAKTCSIIFGVNFEKVVEYYVVKAVKSDESQNSLVAKQKSKFTLIQLPQKESK